MNRDWFSVTVWALIAAWVVIIGWAAVHAVINLDAYLNR